MSPEPPLLPPSIRLGDPVDAGDFPAVADGFPSCYDVAHAALAGLAERPSHPELWLRELCRRIEAGSPTEAATWRVPLDTGEGVAEPSEVAGAGAADDASATQVVRCPNGHENPPGAHFCGECGGTLGTQPPVLCSQGHANRPKTQFCHECGEMLPAGKVARRPSAAFGRWLSVNKNRYIAGAVLGAVVIAVVLILLLRGGGSGSSAPTTAGPAPLVTSSNVQTNFTDYLKSAVVPFTDAVCGVNDMYAIGDTVSCTDFNTVDGITFFWRGTLVSYNPSTRYFVMNWTEVP